MGLVMQKYSNAAASQKSTIIDLMGGLIPKSPFKSHHGSIGYTFHYYVTRMDMTICFKNAQTFAGYMALPTEEKPSVTAPHPFIIHAYMLTRLRKLHRLAQTQEDVVSRRMWAMCFDLWHHPNHQDSKDE